MGERWLLLGERYVSGFCVFVVREVGGREACRRRLGGAD